MPDCGYLRSRAFFLYNFLYGQFECLLVCQILTVVFTLSTENNKKTDTGGRAFPSIAPKSVRQASAVFCHSYQSFSKI